MKELSLYILDLVQNSLRAEAKNIQIMVKDSISQDRLEIAIKDDGYGMDQALLSKVAEPFVTTRTTRQIGMGIPLFKMAAELTGGTFCISSTPGQGTTLQGIFTRSHIDIPPMGDMTETIVTLVQGAPDVDFLYTNETDMNVFRFDTKDIREVLEDVPLNAPDVLHWIREHLTAAISETN
ncbi:MAG: ATP-binding protein [Firmicutes bacterium]|nr:ATP-binding protein [Bacillota bacterium]